jgi:hypothetical protein
MLLWGDMPEEKESFNLVDAASDLFGALAGGVTVAAVCHDISGILAGPVGVGVAHTLRYGANLFVSRLLANREKARVGLVYGLVAHRIKSRLDRGEQLRTDGFFNSDATDRSPADEIAEAILQTAQREYEERKLPYFANLLAFMAFTPEIDRSTGNLMVRLAGSLSYRQFCVLALGNDSIRTSLNQSDPTKVAQAAALHLSLLNEIFALYQSRSIDLGTLELTRPVDPRAMPFEYLKLGEIGQYLYQAMDLGAMPQSEYSDIFSALSALSS